MSEANILARGRIQTQGLKVTMDVLNRCDTQWLKQIINESRVFQGRLVINEILMLGFVFGDRSPY